MIQLLAIDTFAEHLSAMQRAFLLSLHGLVMENGAAHNGTVARFQRDAAQMKAAHVITVRRLSETALVGIAQMADVRPQVETSVVHLMDMVEAQLNQLVLLFVNRLRREHFARRLGERPIVGSFPRLLDRLGRRGDSGLFAYLVARKAALDAYNDSVYLDRINNGGTGLVAVIRHENAQHESNGIVLTPFPTNPGEITYTEARERIFHPRARAIVS